MVGQLAGHRRVGPAPATLAMAVDEAVELPEGRALLELE
jgi:hypothetical protein